MNTSPSAYADVGRLLRAAREEKTWSLEEMRHRTRIPVEQLARIEEGRGQDGPGAAIVRGQIRICARELGVEVGSVLGDTERLPLPLPSCEPPPVPEVLLHSLAGVLSGVRFPRWVAGAGVVLVLLGLGAVVMALRSVVLSDDGANAKQADIVLVESPGAPPGSSGGEEVAPENDPFPLLEVHSVDIGTLMSEVPDEGATTRAVVAPRPVPAEREAPSAGSHPWREALAWTQEKAGRVRGWMAGWVIGESHGESPPAPVVTERTHPVLPKRPPEGDAEGQVRWSEYEKSVREEERWETACAMLEPHEGNAAALLELPDVARHSSVRVLLLRVAEIESLWEGLVRERGAQDPRAVRVQERLVRQRAVLDEVVLQFPELVRQKHREAVAARELAASKLGN